MIIQFQVISIQCNSISDDINNPKKLQASLAHKGLARWLKGESKRTNLLQEELQKSIIQNHEMKPSVILNTVNS